jgi:serine/threonine protein kinase
MEDFNHNLVISLELTAILNHPDLLQLRSYLSIHLSMLKPGKPLKQRPQYVIEEEIGAGGFGVTYKAKHKDLNFPVVIKTPNSHLCRDANYPKYVEGFRKEEH